MSLRPYMIDKYCCCLLPAFRYELGPRGGRDDACNGDASLKKSSVTTFCTYAC